MTNNLLYNSLMIEEWDEKSFQVVLPTKMVEELSEERLQELETLLKEIQPGTVSDAVEREPEYHWLSLGEMVPAKANRYVKPKDIKDRLKSGFSWNLFGVLIVALMPDSYLAQILDGGNRWTKALVTFQDLNKKVPCHVIDLRTNPETGEDWTKEEADAYAAKLFLKFNGDASRNVTPEQRFWAQVIAGDPVALDMLSILKDTKVHTGRVNHPDEGGNATHFVKFTTFVKCYNKDKKALHYALTLIKECWGSRLEAQIDPNFLGGLVTLFTLKGLGNPNLDPKDNNMCYYKLCGKVNGGKAIPNSNELASRTFKEWLTAVAILLQPSSDPLKFHKYRNTPVWYDGIAYGIYNVYWDWAKERGLKLLHKGPIKKFYDYKVSKGEDKN